MKISEAKKTTLFGARCYLGDLFAEKKLVDFKDDDPNKKDGKTAEEKYGEYLRSVEKTEYVDLREATATELKSIEGVPEDFYRNCPPSLVEQRFAEFEAKNKDSVDRLKALAFQCLTGNSTFKDDTGNPATLDQIRELLQDNTRAGNRLVEAMVECSKDFRKPNGPKSGE